MNQIFTKNMSNIRGYKEWMLLLKKYPITELDHIDWIWSDQHFGHKNIIRYSDRPFADISEMHEVMLDNYNSVVRAGDVVVWLGDVAFLPDAEANKLLHRFTGHKILIIGNHDLGKKLHFNETYVAATYRDSFLTHYPMEEPYNIHGHEHNAQFVNRPNHFNVNVEFHNYTPIRIEACF